MHFNNYYYVLNLFHLVYNNNVYVVMIMQRQTQGKNSVGWVLKKCKIIVNSMLYYSLYSVYIYLYILSASSVENYKITIIFVGLIIFLLTFFWFGGEKGWTPTPCICACDRGPWYILYTHFYLIRLVKLFIFILIYCRKNYY